MHRSAELLKDALLAAGETAGVLPSYHFRHHKGAEVEVLLLSYREADREPLVTYRELPQGVCWTRTLEEFSGKTLVSGVWVPRFTPVPRAG